jgi:hypothetical protein
VNFSEIIEKPSRELSEAKPGYGIGDIHGQGGKLDALLV